jgi:hypothetical protein
MKNSKERDSTAKRSGRLLEIFIHFHTFDENYLGFSPLRRS